MAKQLGLPCCPDLLQRTVKTRSLEGLGRDERYAALQSVIRIHPKRRHHIEGRSVLLVDDVMTSGATLSAATQACFSGGAADVSIVALARVGKDA